MSTPHQYPQLGRYQVINRIASGGMAEVFLANAVGAMGFQRLVALKLIHSNFTRDEDFVKMFIDEARIAMHLHHRNIVQVFDLDTVAGTYFIAMEYVHGVNLYDLYERFAEHDRWIDPPLAIYLVAEVCKGLHFAHTRTDSQGRPMTIVHRDVSPQNVLLSFEGEVKITDFGIATAAQRLHQTAAGIVKGKYAYMAPERLQERPIDARVDVFSTGVLLYELLAGENPFAGGSAVETIENVLKREVPPPSSRGAPITRGLDDICLKALAKDPDKRFSDAQTLAEVLTEYAMDLTTARKDMASGDAAVANLLGDLFPEKQRQPEAAVPGSLIIPGVDEGPFDTARNQVTKPDVGDDDDDEDDDFDAPTVLRMEAVTGLDDIPTPRSQQRAGSDVEPDELVGSHTEPTELPPIGADSAGPQLADDDDDRFVTTKPSTPGIDTKPDDTPVLRSTRARPSPYPSPSVSPAPARGGQYGYASRSVVPDPHGRQSGSDSHEALVVPVEGGSLANRKLNLIAGGLLVVALLVVGAALLVVQRSETTFATLSIRTQPTGATVVLNDRRLDQPTPVDHAVLAGEPAILVLEMAGHQPIRREVVPRAGELVVVDEKLRRIEGQLVVIPTPDRARVVVDGQQKGTGKVQVNGLPLDKQIEVRVELGGYVPFTQALKLTAGEPQQTLAVPLAPEPRRNRPRRR